MNEFGKEMKYMKYLKPFSDQSPNKIERERTNKDSTLESSVKYEPTPQHVYRWKGNTKQPNPGVGMKVIQIDLDHQDQNSYNSQHNSSLPINNIDDSASVKSQNQYRPQGPSQFPFTATPQAFYTQQPDGLKTQEIVPVSQSRSGHAFNERKIELAPHGIEICDGDSDDMINVEEDSPERPFEQIDQNTEDNQPLFSSQFYPEQITTMPQPESKRSISFNPNKAQEDNQASLIKRLGPNTSNRQEEQVVTPEPFGHPKTTTTHPDLPSAHSRIRMDSANFSDICNYESGNDRYSQLHKFRQAHPPNLPLAPAQVPASYNPYPPIVESSYSATESIAVGSSIPQSEGGKRDLDDTNARTIGKFDNRAVGFGDPKEPMSAISKASSQQSYQQQQHQIPNFQVDDIISPYPAQRPQTSYGQAKTQQIRHGQAPSNEIEAIISRESAYANMPAFKKETSPPANLGQKQQAYQGNTSARGATEKDSRRYPRQGQAFLNEAENATKKREEQKRRRASKSPIGDAKKMRGRGEEHSKSAKKRQVNEQLKSRSKTKGQKDDQNEELIQLEEEYYRLMHLQKQAHLKEMRKTARDKQQAQNLKAALVLQKYTRGFIARLRFRKMQQVYNIDLFYRENFKYIRKLRRFLSVGFKQIKFRLLKRVKIVLKECGDHQVKQSEVLYNQFRHHCASLIQKSFRGYYIRQFILPKLKESNIIYQKIRAFGKAWKIRHVMQTRDILQIRAGLQDTDRMIEEFMYMNATSDKSTNFSQNLQMINQLKKNRKKQVELLIKTISQLYKNGNWVSRYLNQSDLRKRPDHKDKQKDGIFIQTNNNVNQKNRMNDRYNPQNQMQMAAPLVKQQSFDAPRPYFDSNNQDSSKMQYPQNSAYPKTFEMYKTADHPRPQPGYQAPLAQNMIGQQNYPGPNGAGMPVGPPEEFLQYRNYAPQPQKFVSPRRYEEPKVEEEEEDEDIDAYLERMQKLKDQENQVNDQQYQTAYPQREQNWEQDRDGFYEEEDVFTAETPMKTPPRNSKPVSFEVNLQNSPPAFGQPNVPSKFNEDAPAVAKGAYILPPQEDEVYQLDDQQEAPKYDFEEMLRRAMEQNGEKFEEAPPSDSQEQKPVAKKKFQQKKAKYDPRKAVEEEKKKKKQEKKEHKSAFPKGFFGNKEDEEEQQQQKQQKPKKSNKKDENSNQVLETEDQFYKNSESDKSRKASQEFQDLDDGEGEGQGEEKHLEKGKKTFLKRKSKAPTAQKLNWKTIGSKIDCWTSAKTAQKNIQATTTPSSAPSSAPSQPPKKRQAVTPKKQQEKLNQKKRPPVIQKQQQRMVVEGHEEDDFTPLESISSMPNVPSTQGSQGPNFGGKGRMMEQTIPKFYVKDEEDIETIPDEKDQIDKFLNSGPTQVLQVPFGQFSRSSEFDDTSFQSQGGQPPMVLCLDELTKIYDVFHPDGVNLVDQGFIKEKSSLIPKMNSHSLFFQCYSDDIYEVSKLV